MNKIILILLTNLIINKSYGCSYGPDYVGPTLQERNDSSSHVAEIIFIDSTHSNNESHFKVLEWIKGDGKLNILVSGFNETSCSDQIQKDTVIAFLIKKDEKYRLNYLKNSTALINPKIFFRKESINGKTKFTIDKSGYPKTKEELKIMNMKK